MISNISLRRYSGPEYSLCSHTKVYTRAKRDIYKVPQLFKTCILAWMSWRRWENVSSSLICMTVWLIIKKSLKMILYSLKKIILIVVIKFMTNTLKWSLIFCRLTCKKRDTGEKGSLEKNGSRSFQTAARKKTKRRPILVQKLHQCAKASWVKNIQI